MEDLVCPFCGETLEYHDYYGAYPGSFRAIGEIHRCKTVGCDGDYFYTATDQPGVLLEGFPRN